MRLFQRERSSEGGVKIRNRCDAHSWAAAHRVVVADRMRRRSAVREAERAHASGVQGSAAELEDGAAERSGCERQVVGGLSGCAAERTGRSDQRFESDAEGRASAV